MRALSPTLLAAQRRLGALPTVRVRVQDRELRWAALIDDNTSVNLTAACPAAGGIVRGRVAGGCLDVQRIVAPNEPQGWLAWQPLAADAAPGADVALSSLSGDPARLRLFYVRTRDGALAVACFQSEDGGASWSGPFECVGGLAAPAALASANAQLLFHDPGDGLLKLALADAWQAGGWAVHPWLAGSALASRHGLAAGHEGATYYVASCDEEAPDVRRLRTGTFDADLGIWTDPVAVVPPGLPTAGFVPRYPALARSGGLWYLSYLEAFTGATTWAWPVVIHSADWAHWSYACRVPLEGWGGAQRPALLHHGGAFYLALERAVWQAPAYNAADPAKCLEVDGVAGYLAEEAPWSGRTVVELYNPCGRYDRPCAPLLPLAEVVVERGYRTAAGEERVARAPSYIVGVAVRRGGSRPTLHLECEDGWGLLARWQPDALYLWQGRTVGWLIAEVLYRATGLACVTDGLSAWGTVLDGLAMAPGGWPEALSDARRAWLSREMRAAGAEAAGTTGLAVLRTLLAKVGGAARWQADGSLYCFIPSAQPTVGTYTIGAGGEVLDALYGRGLVWPTEVRVFGEGAAAVAAASADSPRRYVATCVDAHLQSPISCARRAAGLAHEGRAQRYGGWVETPCQPGLELHDLVGIDDERAGELAGECLRVVGIAEQYDPAGGALTTRATFQGA